jgi:hypothetical protein
MIFTGEIQSTWGKTCSSATLSTTNVTCTFLRLKYSFRLRTISHKQHKNINFVPHSKHISSVTETAINFVRCSMEVQILFHRWQGPHQYVVP